MQPTDEALATNLRYVQRAYWRLLYHCYFATDTENTKVQVGSLRHTVCPAIPHAVILHLPRPIAKPPQLRTAQTPLNLNPLLPALFARSATAPTACGR